MTPTSSKPAGQSRLTASLLEPRIVAVVGASDDVRKPGARVLRSIIDHGFQGDVFAVNPGYSEVQGVPSYPTISLLPSVPDLAVIAVPLGAALDSIRDCAVAGVSTVVVLSAMAVGDAAARRVITTTRREFPATRILGPNSLGVHSAYARFAGSFMTAAGPDFRFQSSDVVIISQSGGVGAYLLSIAHSDGLAIGAFVSTGVELDIRFTDVLNDVVDRYAPALVFGYLEGADNRSDLQAALEHAHSRHTAVLLVRAGSTQAGREAIERHSGLRTWDDVEWREYVDPSGALTLESIEEAVDIGRTLVATPAPRGNRLTIMAASGGAGILMTDAAGHNNLQLAEWTEAQKSELVELLPSYAVVENPIDATGAIFSPLATLRRLLELCLAHSDTDVVVLTLGNMPHVEKRLFDEVEHVARRSTKPLIVVWSGGSRDAIHQLSQRKVLAFTDPVRCANALRRALNHPTMPPAASSTES